MSDAETSQPLRDGDTPPARGRRRQTRESILAATKDLVARKGPHATTVRDITQASGANVAAVNYYFQSKDNLVAIATREIGAEINDERVRRLESLLQASGGAPLAPAEIVRALVLPIGETSRAADGGSLYVRNVYQMRTVPYAEENRQHVMLQGSVAQKFITEIRRSLPRLSRAEAVWRYELVRGGALHMAANVDPLWRRFEILELGPSGSLPEEPAIRLDDAFLERLVEALVPILTR
ncbi:TetR/AcrR family transcriptional regulator [Mangrovicoccus algicola]|uniref:TetR family transcriptional regulator n=1 Tax=Mangrovicoccus algicola TaxID=2771008 RepID=A0A8J6Z9X9_9RHOB|nr:TetR/AcrR family transcriptional regulator [Mangrovicoccus algicola]MBE3638771.1 TetR family transcriptional regulator [Mangrovicoccus algicola]